MLAFLLAFAIAISPFTALRGDEAFGPTDMLLAGAVALTAIVLLRGRQRSPGSHDLSLSAKVRSAVFTIAAYEVMSTVILVTSTVANWRAVAVHENPVIAVLPYVVAAALSWAIYLQVSVAGLEKLLRGYCLISAGVLVLYLVGYLAGVGDFFFYHRFKGLSANSNQTALHTASFLVANAMCLIKYPPRSRILRWVFMLNVVLSVILGVATQSDAFIIALAVTSMAAVVHFGWAAMARSRMALGAGILVLPPLILVVMLPNLEKLADITRWLQDRIAYGNQDSDRLALWVHGLEAWRDRWLLGHGVGAWSGFVRPYEGVESHNTVIEILSMEGIVGGLLFLLLIAWFIRHHSFKDHGYSYYALGFLLALSMFHVTIRHPVFWIAMAAIFAPAGTEGLTRPSRPLAPHRIVRPRPASRPAAPA